MSDKTIRVIHAWKPVISFTELERSPPEGYCCEAPRPSSPLIPELARFGFSYRYQSAVGGYVPLQLLMSALRSRVSKSDLIYAVTSVHRWDRPWVLDMLTELPALLTTNERLLSHFRGWLRRLILDENCKGVVFWVDAGRRAFLQTLGYDLGEKAHTVRWGKRNQVNEMDLRSRIGRSKIRLLFVNSGNINTPEHFYAKGGLETIHAFMLLRKRFPSLELVVRSNMPDEFKRYCRSFPNLHVIDDVVSREEIHTLWKSADIFVLPNHVNTPASVFLDAMSYGLPVVTTDIWANAELIQDGTNGLLIHHEQASEYVDQDVMHLNSKKYSTLIRNGNKWLVRALSENLAKLIDSEELRFKIGKQNVLATTSGDFSAQKRNSRLKDFLDKATR